MPPNRHERRRAHREMRKASKGSEPSPSPNPPVFFEDPLAAVPRDALRAAVVARGTEAQRELPELITQLKGRLAKCEPTYFLATMSITFLTAGVTEAGKLVKPERSPTRLDQHHLELAQAFYLTLDRNSLSSLPGRPDEIQAIIDGLRRVTESFYQARYAQLEEADPGDLDARRLQERLRLHTQGVRNWGYYHHVLDILERLYTPLDGVCRKATGLEATAFLKLFDFMLREIERRTMVYRDRMRSTLVCSTKSDMVQTYVSNFSLPKSNADELIATVRAECWSRQALIAFLVHHSGLFATDICRFTCAELSSAAQTSCDSLKSGLAQVSYKLEALQSVRQEHIFLSNPIWERPLIAEDNDSYFCCMPQVFFGFSFHIFNRLLGEQRESGEAHAHRRAAFLEAEIATAFSSAFGNGLVEANVRWCLDRVRYETDLLVQFDSQLFIVEAKSNKISWAALRGARDRVRRHVDEIIVAPAQQSKRLADAIQARLRGETVELEIQTRIDFARVKDVTRLSVSLEDFATIQSNLKELRHAGLLPSDFEMPLSISIADLRSIFFYLESATERVYYLKRRIELQNTTEYLADELDLLGLYITTGLVLGEIEEGKTRLVAIGMSEQIDEYFQLEADGVRANKPQRRLGSWVRAVLSRLEKRKGYRWSEAAYILLSASYDDQVQLERQAERVRRDLLKRRSIGPDDINTVVLSPPRWSKLGLACVFIRPSEVERRHEIMAGAADQVFANSGAERSLIIARDIADKHFPYASIGMFDRPTE